MKIASFKAGGVASYGIVTDAGIVIVTGTTGGFGAYRIPPLWMKEGDVVEVEISGIGILRNPVKNEVAEAVGQAA
jgi:2-keto-4-pentenoate hydratase/2-oxohepta-3-ene-1,7-dioic acid hydratase in catechol pathway